MSWMDSDWSYRYPVFCKATATALEVQTITIPADWDYFWDSIKAGGADIRITASGGINLIDFELAASFSTTNNTIDIDPTTVTMADSVNWLDTDYFLAWIYWGNQDATTASQTVGPPVAAKATKIIHYGPGEDEAVISCIHEAVGVTTISQSLSIIATEVLAVWWDVTPALRKRSFVHNGSLAGEELQHARWTITNTSTIVTGSAMKAEEVGCAEIDGRFYIMTHIVGLNLYPHTYEMEATFRNSCDDAIERKFHFRCSVKEINPAP